jgi:aminopeptidase
MLDREEPAAGWHLLSEKQARLIDCLRLGKEFRLVTPAGTDLRLGIAGRRWINGDGHENLPDGEVSTAPIEDATEGTIFIDIPAVHNGRVVDGIRLVFRAGQVVEASANAGQEYLLGLLGQAGARVLGEVALGCNYGIARNTQNALLDEKIGGTCHVALGAAYPPTGGKNQAPLHWDMVCDLRDGGRVEVDGRLISKNGRFLEPDWPQPSEFGERGA